MLTRHLAECYVSSDPKDPRALTPNDFLNRAPTSDCPPGSFTDALPRERYQYVQKMVNLFWDMWKKQNLQSPGRSGPDLLEISKLAISSFLWRRTYLGANGWPDELKKTYQGSDDLVRVVDVRTAQGVYRRTVHTICLLEETKRHIVDKPLVTGEYVVVDIEGKGVPFNVPGVENENQ